MIHRYVYGTVIETDAVLHKPEAETGAPPFFSVDAQARTFTHQMGDRDRVYGLGENVRGINKRGWIYESRCSDDPNHTEDKRSLYGVHNFLVLDGQERFGVFIDYPGVLTVDAGCTRHSELKITASDWNLDCYMKLVRFRENGIMKEELLAAGDHYVAVSLTDKDLEPEAGGYQ